METPRLRPDSGRPPGPVYVDLRQLMSTSKLMGGIPPDWLFVDANR